jgi:hypothetical protein
VFTARYGLDILYNSPLISVVTGFMLCAVLAKYVTCTGWTVRGSNSDAG